MMNIDNSRSFPHGDWREKRAVHKRPILLSDAPVDNSGDLIWANSDIAFDLEMITDTILSSEAPLVFLVHGPWGSGKTSFLKMVEGNLQDQQEHDIFLSWYIASNYQAIGDASTTLTLRILKTISGDERSDKAKSLYDDILKLNFDNPHAKSAEFAYGQLQDLAKKVSMLADLGIYIENFLNDGIVASGKSKLILMIDDLDRCTLEYIGDVIETMQRLSSVKNMFIFLAVDQARLQKALDLRFADVKLERGPRWAGEKYIQHTIELPPLTKDNFILFIRKSLLGENNTDEDIPNDPALEIILESAEFLKIAIRDKMPRTVKACINLLRPELTKEITKNPNLQKDEKLKIIKRKLISYLFRDFYVNWFVKAVDAINTPERHYFIDLEHECDLLNKEISQSTDTYATFKFKIERLKSTHLLEQKESFITEELARLLACPPYFIYKAETSLILNFAEKQLEAFYEQSELARERGDDRLCVTICADAHKLIEENAGSLSKNVNWRINNLALNAEEYNQYDLAIELYRCNLKIDPTYVTSMANFAKLIIFNRPELLDEAKNLLDNAIQNFPDNPGFIRAVEVKLILSNEQNKPIDQEIELLNKSVDSHAESIIKSDILYQLVISDNYLPCFELYKLISKKLSTLKQRINLAINFAFNLAQESKSGDDQIALDIIRHVLSINELDEENYLKAASGYAILLYPSGYSFLAGNFFFKLYQKYDLIPKDTRKVFDIGFAEYLRLAERTDLAEQLEHNQPLTIDQPITFGTEKELPTHFFEKCEVPNIFEV